MRQERHCETNKRRIDPSALLPVRSSAIHDFACCTKAYSDIVSQPVTRMVATALLKDLAMYLAKLKLDGRVAVVTGAGQGIGAACARALGEAGASIIVADMLPDRI